MKKRILLLCILTILFSTGMEGCPDPENYVVLTVQGDVSVSLMDEDCEHSESGNANNIEVLIEVMDHRQSRWLVL